jgi:hypothetical protein
MHIGSRLLHSLLALQKEASPQQKHQCHKTQILGPVRHITSESPKLVDLPVHAFMEELIVNATN